MSGPRSTLRALVQVLGTIRLSCIRLFAQPDRTIPLVPLSTDRVFPERQPGGALAAHGLSGRSPPPALAAS